MYRGKTIFKTKTTNQIKIMKSLALGILGFHVNLKHKREHLKRGKRKSSSNGQLLKSTKISRTKEPPGGRQPGCLSSLALAMCLSEIGFLERGAPLKWMPALKWTPQQSKLSSGTCVTKRKARCRAHTAVAQCLS